MSDDRYMRIFWKAIWETSEFLHIGLGKYSEYVFSRMIGITGKKID